jgi:hypothetical protein
MSAKESFIPAGPNDDFYCKLDKKDRVAYNDDHSGAGDHVLDGSAMRPRPFFGQPRLLGHLYFPQMTDNDDIHWLNLSMGPAGLKDHLIAARNLFCFLLNGTLVATSRLSDPFIVLLNIASQLEKLGFVDDIQLDYGLVATNAFSQYIESSCIHKFGKSGRRMAEALVLAEKMRHKQLWYDAFTHVVGCYQFMTKSERDVIAQHCSRYTRQKIDREVLDLRANRTKLVVDRLTDFQFPHVFRGTAQSKVTVESRVVNFGDIELAYKSIRIWLLSRLKREYGHWPPKSGSNHHDLRIAGLNRVVLRALYRDICSLYDLLGDRTVETNRGLDEVLEEKPEEEMTTRELEILALRKMMSEHDLSTPTPAPPIFFDLPQVPEYSILDAGHSGRGTPEKSQNESRKLTSDERNLVLAKTHNYEMEGSTPFLTEFAEFELRQAKGADIRMMRSQRYGYWMFIYCVIQTLPFLVIDAPELKYTDGLDTVEYFLCKPPIQSPPWLQSIYPHADPDANTIYVVFLRSHCWNVANRSLVQKFEKEQAELKKLAAGSPLVVSATTASGASSPTVYGSSVVTPSDVATPVHDPPRLDIAAADSELVVFVPGDGTGAPNVLRGRQAIDFVCINFTENDADEECYPPFQDTVVETAINSGGSSTLNNPSVRATTNSSDMPEPKTWNCRSRGDRVIAFYRNPSRQPRIYMDVNYSSSYSESPSPLNLNLTGSTSAYVPRPSSSRGVSPHPVRPSSREVSSRRRNNRSVDSRREVSSSGEVWQTADLFTATAGETSEPSSISSIAGPSRPAAPMRNTAPASLHAHPMNRPGIAISGTTDTQSVSGWVGHTHTHSHSHDHFPISCNATSPAFSTTPPRYCDRTPAPLTPLEKKYFAAPGGSYVARPSPSREFMKFEDFLTKDQFERDKKEIEKEKWEARRRSALSLLPESLGGKRGRGSAMRSEAAGEAGGEGGDVPPAPSGPTGPTGSPASSAPPA